LTRLVKDSQHPVVFIFAGKAHPQDGPGQEYLHAIYQLSRHPDFEGKIVLLEAYDIELARFLVTGVDVWFNTPEYPMEASGTSGQKAAINGVPHFSVLDGWWEEGYEGNNGWAISPYLAGADKNERDYVEASGAFDLLEGEILPLYYKRNGQGYSADWVQVAKQAMISALSRFSAQRMLTDYITEYYSPAAKLGQKFVADDAAWAKELVAWKNKVEKAWSGVMIRRSQLPAEGVRVGDEARLAVQLFLNGLSPEDVRVECLISDKSKAGRLIAPRVYPLSAVDDSNNGWRSYEGEIGLTHCGRYSYQLRAYPHHNSLSHRLEMGHMLWL
jgi:starch phosphorylase